MTVSNGRTLYESELRGGRLVYLLELEWAGRTFRWATKMLDLTTASDGDYPYYPMVIDEPEETIAFAGDSSPGDKSVSVSCVFPVNVAQFVAYGHDLSTAAGEFSVIVDGGTWEDRVPLFSGRLTSPTYGDADQPTNGVAFTLEELEYNDTALYPASDQVIPDGLFLGPPDQWIGSVVPWVFGYPGGYRKFDGLTRYSVDKAAPAVPLSTFNKWIIVHAGRIDSGTPGNNVTLYNATTDTSDDLPVTARVDYQRRVVYTVTAPTYPVTADYWTSMWGGITSAYGAAAALTDPHKAMDGAGDVLAHMLFQSSLKIDRGRVLSARGYLNRFHVSGYIDDFVSPAEWVEQYLVPILPMSIVSGPDGLYPLVWRYDAVARDAVAWLTEGPGWSRIGGPETESDDVVNDLTIEFAPDGSDYMRSIRMSGELSNYIYDDDSGDPQYDQHPNLYARVSYQRYKKLISDTISSDIVWENETALLILGWRMKALALARRTLKYTADVGYAWLQPGDVISLTDSDLKLTSQLGLIRSKKWGAASLSFEVLLLEDPVRDSKQLT